MRITVGLNFLLRYKSNVANKIEISDYFLCYTTFEHVNYVQIF